MVKYIKYCIESEMCKMAVCPLCEEEAREITSREDKDREIWSYDCQFCGKYSLVREAWDDFLSHANYSSIKYKISAFTREKTIHSQSKIVIASPNLRKEDYHLETMIDFESICNLFPKNFSNRIDRALLNIAQLSGFAGDSFKIEKIDCPLVFADGKNDKAFFFVLKELIGKGFLDGPAVIPGTFSITPVGWDRIYYLETIGNTLSNQGFVAMWFDPSMNISWKKGFYKAIDDTGYTPLKIDVKEHNNMINDEIIAEIRRSKFVVCDFTGQRGGVYFEAGFAMGLNIPVIWTCRKDYMSDCHFDTNHYNHIVWDNEDDLYIKLYNRIRATIV